MYTPHPPGFTPGNRFGFLVYKDVDVGGKFQLGKFTLTLGCHIVDKFASFPVSYSLLSKSVLSYFVSVVYNFIINLIIVLLLHSGVYFGHVLFSILQTCSYNCNVKLVHVNLPWCREPGKTT